MEDTEYMAINEEGKLITIPNMNDLCFSLKHKFERNREIINKLIKENNELKDGIWEKDNNVKMKANYTKMYDEWQRGFPITKEEAEQIRNWKKQHIEEKHNGIWYVGGAIDGNFKYEFVPTSIGVFGSVKCTCGEKFTFQEGS